MQSVEKSMGMAISRSRRGEYAPEFLAWMGHLSLARPMPWQPPIENEIFGGGCLCAQTVVVSSGEHRSLACADNTVIASKSQENNGQAVSISPTCRICKKKTKNSQPVYVSAALNVSGAMNSVSVQFARSRVSHSQPSSDTFLSVTSKM